MKINKICTLGLVAITLTTVGCGNSQTTTKRPIPSESIVTDENTNKVESDYSSNPLRQISQTIPTFYEVVNLGNPYDRFSITLENDVNSLADKDIIDNYSDDGIPVDSDLRKIEYHDLRSDNLSTRILVNKDDNTILGWTLVERNEYDLESEIGLRQVDVSEDMFKKLSIGMSYDDVISVMGEPTIMRQQYYDGFNKDSIYERYNWFSGNSYINYKGVSVLFKNNIVEDIFQVNVIDKEYPIPTSIEEEALIAYEIRSQVYLGMSALEGAALINLIDPNLSFGTDITSVSIFNQSNRLYNLNLINNIVYSQNYSFSFDQKTNLPLLTISESEEEAHQNMVEEKLGTNSDNKTTNDITLPLDAFPGNLSEVTISTPKYLHSAMDKFNVNLYEYKIVDSNGNYVDSNIIRYDENYIYLNFKY